VVAAEAITNSAQRKKNGAGPDYHAYGSNAGEKLVTIASTRLFAVQRRSSDESLLTDRTTEIRRSLLPASGTTKKSSDDESLLAGRFAKNRSREPRKGDPKSRRLPFDQSRYSRTVGRSTKSVHPYRGRINGSGTGFGTGNQLNGLQRRYSR